MHLNKQTNMESNMEQYGFDFEVYIHDPPTDSGHIRPLSVFNCAVYISHYIFIQANVFVVAYVISHLLVV